MVEVTQADRKAAASVAMLVEMSELILAGRADDHAEPFARHRIAALEEAAKVAEQTDTGWADARTFTAQKIATAIRALKGPTDAH